MKVLGIGVDIIDNKRIKTSIKNSKFKNRIYSIKELKQSALFKNKVNYFSKRFAAKEAFAKALGTGFRKNLNYKDIWKCAWNDTQISLVLASKIFWYQLKFIQDQSVLWYVFLSN